MALLLACALLAISAGFTAVWYWLAMRHNRRRALYVLRWIEGAIGPQGQTTGLSWIAHSRFKVPLRLRCGLFHRAWMTVDFRPCEYPLRWLVNKLSGAREVVTFYADLDLPPNFSLHVHNFRWCAQSTRTAGSAGSGVEQCGRFVITTRMDWQREVSSAMTSLYRNQFPAPLAALCSHLAAGSTRPGLAGPPVHVGDHARGSREFFDLTLLKRALPK
jgi:hypothetical protein